MDAQQKSIEEVSMNLAGEGMTKSEKNRRVTERPKRKVPEPVAELTAALKKKLPDYGIEPFNVAYQPDMDGCTKLGVADGVWLNKREIFIGHHPQKPEEPHLVILEQVHDGFDIDPHDPGKPGEATGYTLLLNDDDRMTIGDYLRGMHSDDVIVEDVLTALGRSPEGGKS